MSKTKIIVLTLLISFFSVFSLTLWKVQKKHQDALVLVVEKRIIEAAEDCLRNDDCQRTPITLQKLITEGYLKEEVNPITKMYYKHDSYVDLKDNQYIFVEV